jgi:hypothetical protein
MTTLMIFHEVEDGQQWASAWKQGAGSRHEMFAQIGISTRCFRDPDNINSTGVLLEVPDMERFQTFMASDEAKKAMKKDCLKTETMRVLVEFVP